MLNLTSKTNLVTVLLLSLFITTKISAVPCGSGDTLNIGILAGDDPFHTTTISYEGITGTGSSIKAVGFDALLYCEIARRLGKKIVFKAYSGLNIETVPQAMADINSGVIDMFGGTLLAYDPNSADVAPNPDTYTINYNFVITNLDNNTFTYPGVYINGDDFTSSSYGYGIALNKSCCSLAANVQEALDSIIADGTYVSLVQAQNSVIPWNFDISTPTLQAAPQAPELGISYMTGSISSSCYGTNATALTKSNCIFDFIQKKYCSSFSSCSWPVTLVTV